MYDCNSSDNLAVGYALGRDANNNNNGNNGMWGNDWWAIIVLLCLFGGFGFGGFGGWGFGNGFGGNGGGAVPYVVGNTDAALQRGFDTQTIIGKLDGISNGICSLGYDQLAQMNNLGLSIANGFHGVDNAVCNLGYQTQQGFNATQVAMLQGFNAAQAQAADCCCKTQTAIAGVENSITGLGCTLGREIERGFCDTNYNMATQSNAIQVQMANNTRDIIDSQKAGTQAILSYLCDRQIADLQLENQTLRLAANTANQNNVIRAAIDASTAEILRRTGSDCPVAAYVVPNPNCCYGNPIGVNYNGYGYNGYNNGCGCNTGCCGCNN